jgi:trehalose 6-phosphate synthase/phosphatase
MTSGVVPPRMSVPLINVSNRLPVTLGVDGSIRMSSGGLVTALAGLPAEKYELTWLGWPGREVPDDRQAALEVELRDKHGCTPVFVPQELATEHYEGLSNSSIWPLLHYMPSYFRYQPGWWDAYVQVNRIYADKILSITASMRSAGKIDRDHGALVWVHDYQLMLLPRMLKEADPSLRVGFFLHTPFPSSEVFRCHPNNHALLEGLLGADLCGFHTFGYLRHFRSAVTHVMGGQAEMMTLHHNGRSTRLGVFPIGIAAPKFEQELKSPRLMETLARFANEHRDRKLILSVERLDYTKGIPHRLEAIERFLASLDEDERNKLKFLFISIPTREGVDAYRELRQRVEGRIGQINGKYSTLHNSPLHFLHSSVDFTDLCALYALADVCLVTPLRDGMNLVAKEYVACQTEFSTPEAKTQAAAVADDRGGNGNGAHKTPMLKTMPGVLVLSEFTGAAEELFSAITVNPFDVGALTDAIAAALSMPENERRRRMNSMRHRVMTYDAKAWAGDFLHDLSSRVSAPPIATAQFTPAVEMLEEQRRLAEAVAQRRPIAIFVDYDGTLREYVRDPITARPTNDVRQLLERLAVTENVDVTIISGRSAADLETFLGGFAGFGLVAEHGAALRRPHAKQWERLDRNLTYEWKESIFRILHHYERSTPGSHVEDKHTSLVWHYRRTDSEFGEWRARQLVEDLSALAANDPIEIRHGHRIVEIVSTHVNKGAAVMQALQNRRYDLVLMAGDDTTDESMFRLELPEHHAITIRVGPGETRARLRIGAPRDLRRLIHGALDQAASAASAAADVTK